MAVDVFFNLNIETGRFNNINRNERFCFNCNKNSIEDEYHFILECSRYNDFAILPVSKARTNKFYIYRQCTYIVYIYDINSDKLCTT
jgi:hypothetical protein